MKRLVLLSEWMSLGGAQTLMYRIAREAKKSDAEATIHCRVLVDKQRKLLEKFKIPIVVHKEWFEFKELGLKNDDVCLTLSLFDFLRCKEYTAKQRMQCKILLYVVHPLMLTDFCGSLRMIRHLAESDIRSGIRSGNIIFMDEQCVDTTFEKYRFDFSKEEAVIVRLPIETQPACGDEVIIRRKQHFELLTVARSAFPFKGYMRGLIQVFDNVCRNTEQCPGLTIVTATTPGSDVNTLKSWIDESAFRHNITLALDVDNATLRDYYDSSSLYVGMGTTIIEAAERSVPAVPVEAYTYDCLADHLFFEKPGDLVVREGKGRPIESLIENILAMDQEEYISISKASRDAVVDLYTFSAFFNCIFKTGICIMNLSYPSILSWRIWSFFHRMRIIFDSKQRAINTKSQLLH